MAQRRRSGIARPHKSNRTQYGSQMELAEALRSWAVDEMRFRPQGRHIRAPLPTTEDFAILCRGPMVDVIQYIIQHVHPAQTVQKVKGNLKLQSLLHEQKSNGCSQITDGEVDRLRQECAEVNREFDSLKTNITQVEKEISRLQKDILAKEQLHKASCKKISDLKKRNTLLEAYSKSCQKEANSYCELAKQISLRLSKLTEIARKKPTFFASNAHMDQLKSSLVWSAEESSTPAGLDSDCTISVRDASDEICSFLHEICQIDQKSGEIKRNDDRTRKDRIWTKVEELMVQYPAQAILASLTKVAQESAASLRALTQKIDLKKDAEELKFKYENSRLTDTSSPPTLLQSVHQLIEEGQAADFRQFIESEQAQNEAWRAQKELDALRQQMEAKLASFYADAPQDLELARTLWQSEQEVVASEASLKFIHEALQELESQKKDKQTALEILEAKHRKIKDFEKIVQTNQMLIQALVKQNSRIKYDLSKQTEEALRYIQEKVCSHEGDVKALTDQLADSVSHQVQEFAAVPLDRLQSASSGMVGNAVCDLSVHRLENLENTDGGSSVMTLLNKINFPSYKAPEELLPKTMEVKKQVEDTESLLKFKEEITQGANRHQTAITTVKQLNVLCEKVSEQDNAQMKYVMPIIKDGVANATVALSKCVSLKETANSWWEQPAQFTVPWVKVDNMNMKQWTDRWSCLATKLRQLQVQQ